MPLYEYQCKNAHRHERVRPMSMCEEPSICPTCNGIAHHIPSLIAATPLSWGDTKYGAVNGTYDRGLGATYRNRQERDQIMKQKGVVPLDEIGGDAEIDRRFEKQKTDAKKAEVYTNTFTQAEAGGADMFKAHDLATAASDNI
jgi:putative FmdB family regulatory protein